MVKFLLKEAIFVAFLGFGFTFIGPAYNFSLISTLWAVPAGVVLACVWHTIDTVGRRVA